MAIGSFANALTGGSVKASTGTGGTTKVGGGVTNVYTVNPATDVVPNNQGVATGFSGVKAVVPVAAPVVTKTSGSTSAKTAVSGGTNAATSAAATAAASAARAEAARVAQVQADFNTLRGTTMGSIDDSIGQAASGDGAYRSSILDYLGNVKTQQRTIDNQAVQAELAKMTGTRGILSMVGRGLKSGAVTLANGNSATSSASEALARAYGEIGRGQQAGVNGQYATDINGVEQNQLALDETKDTQTRKFRESKTQTVNGIVNAAVTALNTLNQQAATASLPDRVNIEQQKADIQRRAMAALSQYDQELSNTAAPTSQEARAQAAGTLLGQGAAPDAGYTYTTAAPATLASSNVSTSNLPIYTGAARRDDRLIG